MDHITRMKTALESPTVPAVQFLDVMKNYGNVVALNDIRLSVGRGEFFTLLGPSGSGKTTLLNMISGMITPTSGQILIDGQDVTRVPPRERGLGMVFQNYALMPHMTVFDNVAFPLRMRKVNRHDIERRVMAALKMVRLTSFAERKPKELSGGQQQRVAIARCLVYEPRLVLMDEPLGALDKKLRIQLQFEIKKIHEELGVTIMYVTHDQEEAMAMSDRICVMNHARIEQVGTPRDLYFRPSNEFVAEFLGESNIITGTVEKITDSVACVQLPDGWRVSCAATENEARIGSPVKIMVRPESLRVTTFDQQSGIGMRGTIEDLVFVGQAVRYVISSGALRLTSVNNSGYGTPTFARGDEVWADWSYDNSIAIQ
ncbi:ABC transporter ATP-binding protein [Bradyrhizobium sp. 145]|uniref:ABC transporter ATP-binding protein n=1 Tax=Bradyrhizobium sp. 145 TaxID=2782621 RepID=UPI001FF785BD|nr:ABC transporter ATP-binding protein [Bradyrhizobium sp. 145]